MPRFVFIALPLAFLMLCAPAEAQWRGRGEAGIVLARGNADADTLNVKIETARQGDRWKQNFGITALRTAVEGLTTAERYGASWQADYEPTDRSYWFGGVRNEQDEVAGFDYQASATTGLGYRFIDSDETKFSGQLGVGYRRSQRISGGMTEEDAVLRSDLKLERSFTETTKLLNSLVVETGSSNTFASNELALHVKMTDRFALSVGLDVRHNTEPPPELDETDTLTTVNLVYAF